MEAPPNDNEEAQDAHDDADEYEDDYPDENLDPEDTDETMEPALDVVDPNVATVAVDKSSEEVPPEPVVVPEEDKGPDMSITGPERAMLMGFLAGIIERFKLVSLLPGANASGDTSIKMDKVNDGYEVLKAMMLDNASLVLRPFQRGAKPSKFAIETRWILDVLSSTLKEVDEFQSFSSLATTVEEGERREKHLPKALERIQALTSEMHELRQILLSEVATHKAMEREWNKTLASLKQGIKDLKKENKIQAKYRADILAATADCSRRGRDVAIKAAREESEILKSQIEVEKRVNTRCLEFVKKQNLQLMEEAITLQSGLENDMVQMDIMIKRIREQRNEKQAIVNELEPRYIEEMAKEEAEKAELERQRNISIEQQGQDEMKLRATMRVQRTYRGFKSRVSFKKELKKWRKKQKKDKKKK